MTSGEEDLRRGQVDERETRRTTRQTQTEGQTRTEVSKRRKTYEYPPPRVRRRESQRVGV